MRCMSYQISYTSILYTEWPKNSMFTGSSKHRLVDGELFIKKRNPNQPAKFKKIKKSKVDSKITDSIEETASSEKLVVS